MRPKVKNPGKLFEESLLDRAWCGIRFVQTAMPLRRRERLTSAGDSGEVPDGQNANGRVGALATPKTAHLATARATGRGAVRWLAALFVSRGRIEEKRSELKFMEEV